MQGLKLDPIWGFMVSNQILSGGAGFQTRPYWGGGGQRLKLDPIWGFMVSNQILSGGAGSQTRPYIWQYLKPDLFDGTGS